MSKIQRYFPWPASLFGRLGLILFFGLSTAHLLSFWLILQQRADTQEQIMMTYISHDIPASLRLLESLPAEQRQTLLQWMSRENFNYALGPIALGPPATAPMAQAIGQRLAQSLAQSADQHPAVQLTTPPDGSRSLQLRFYLRDGTPLTISITPVARPYAQWLPLALVGQLLLLWALSWLAVRLTTRPLRHLAQAAEQFGLPLESLSLAAPSLPEQGPTEVRQANKAFNAMQQRIRQHLQERMHILAAISHDLQTPITRLRLRTDLWVEGPLKHKFQGDLEHMQALVEEGIAYARAAYGLPSDLSHPVETAGEAMAPGSLEKNVPVDLYALLDSLTLDYQDAGQAVRFLNSRPAPPWLCNTRPKVLQRILINILDNALKYGERAEISLARPEGPTSEITISIRDHGPGIPAEALDAVLQPFYRLEPSRNRESGGTGLGLAIAHQLTLGLGARLALSNGDGGGLVVQLILAGEAR